MKKFFPAILSAAAFPLCVFGDEISHAVSEVSVFSDRAVVTRTGTAHLKKGKNEIVFSGVRDNIDLRSVRAGKNVPAGVEILGVSWERHVSKTVANAEIARLENELRALRLRLSELSDEARILRSREKLAQNYAELSRRAVAEQSASAGEFSDGNTWENSAAELSEIILAARSRRDEIDAQKSEIEQKISRKERELGKIYGGGNARKTLSLVVTLNAETDGDASIPVSYTTYQASWTPQYDARVNVAESGVDFSYNGIVRQNTGEDWRGIKLTLSTAQAQIGAFPPETPTLVLSGEKTDAAPEIVQREIALPEAALPANQKNRQEITANDDSAEAENSPAAGLSRVRSQGASVTFDIAGTHDVSSNGIPRRVAIAQKTFADAEFSVEAAPRLRGGIYLRAKTKNETPFPILAGEIDIYRDSGFLGKSALKFTPVAADISFFAGTLDGLSVAVEKIPPFRQKGKLFSSVASGKNAVAEGEIYTLTNLTETPRKVRVRSQIKVSEIDDVKIEILDAPVERVPATTRGYVLEKETGMLFWDVDVPANGETRLVLSTQTTTENR